jgi:hypothetical protein
MILMLYSAGMLEAQTPREYVPFADTKKAMTAIARAPIIRDSLKRVYQNRWTIGFVYGQRFLSADSEASIPDTITFSDFTNRRSSFGLQLGYFITNRLQVAFTADFLLLPREQNVDTLQVGGPNGVRVNGSGNGGAMVNLGIGGHYYLLNKTITRPYGSFKAGFIRAVAEGGTGGFTRQRGRFQETTRLSHSYGYIQPGIGITHRWAPGSMIDFHVGYLISSGSSDNIGGITSPEGVYGSLTFQIIIGANE